MKTRTNYGEFLVYLCHNTTGKRIIKPVQQSAPLSTAFFFNRLFTEWNARGHEVLRVCSWHGAPFAELDKLWDTDRVRYHEIIHDAAYQDAVWTKPGTVWAVNQSDEQTGREFKEALKTGRAYIHPGQPLDVDAFLAKHPG